ncbi:hypothetical protein D3C71_2176590 [compost metagenome]
MALQSLNNSLQFVGGQVGINLSNPFVERRGRTVDATIALRATGQAHGCRVIEGFSMGIFCEQCT